MGEKPKESGFSVPKLRPYFQGFFFLFFLFLFVTISFPLQKSLVTNLFFNIDPLVALIMALTGSVILSGLLLSLIMIVVTVIFGRIFCGWMCPMGTVLDLTAQVMPKKKASQTFGDSRFKNIKYYVLSFLVLGSIAGFSAVMMFDPLVFLSRIFTVNLYPFFVLIMNQGLNLIRPLALSAGMYELSMKSIEQPVFALGLLNLIVFLAVIGLVAVERRFWCRNLCPLGALLAVLSRFSLHGRRVSDSCINCAKCARVCPMNAIGGDFHETSYLECIQCERCAGVCPTDAITFEFDRPGTGLAFNPSRRGMLFSGTGGILTALAAGSAISTRNTAGTLLRPPGSLVEQDFLDACLRCSECMKACPTHALQPALNQAGLEGFFTPVLVPRTGACEEQCNICGHICPTGAIRALPLIEKQYAVIGNAMINRQWCIAWEQGKVCLICDEVCPYDAVEFRLVTDEKGAIKRPFVLEDKCVGCGQCEKGCPVNGPAAIFVTPVNEVRKNSGSYITEKVKKLREVKDDFVDFSKEKGEQQPAVDTGEIVPEDDSADFDNDMPEGFIQ